MHLKNVLFGSDSAFNTIKTSDCSSLVAYFRRVTMVRPMVTLQAMTSSEIRIRNCSFSVNATEEVQTVQKILSRKRREVSVSDDDTGGILIDYPLQGGKHSLDVINTTITGLKRVINRLHPVGALSIFARKTKTDAKIRVINSTFILNHRAIDFSLKGLVDVRIVNSTFLNNSAEGSGGALRFSASLQGGIGSEAKVEKTKIYITHSTFRNNFANRTDYYNTSDLYYQTRSPGSGGAIYVFIIAPSQLHQDGLVSIVNSSFSGNNAVAKGGTFYVNRDISTEIINCSFANSKEEYRPKVGDIIHASCNMTLANIDLDVARTDSSSAVISYHASDPSNSRLFVQSSNLTCPSSHKLEQLTTTSLYKANGIESLQMFCRICPEDHYSLNTTKVYMNEGKQETKNDVRCVRCPYGAKCTVGIQNNQGFWGIHTAGDVVVMYQCPQEYCEQDGVLTIAFDRCKENRVGILCGHCDEGYSESMFNTDCISNEECGWKNWWVLVVIMSYGIFYLLFFMFEKDYDNFQNTVREKLSVEKEADKKEETPERTNDLNAQKESEEEEEEVDVSKNGYFQIVMYFVQTAELLQVRMLMDGAWNRPKDLLPDLFIEWVGTVLSFDAFALNFGACLFTDMAPVLKTFIKIIYVLYIFGLLLLVYILSGCCCFWMKPKDRPKVTNSSGNSARILMTLISLFLYTYQSLAEYAFQLLNCVTINGDRVLFFDGNVPCMQLWQYVIIGFVVVFIFPFFIVLLFGPKLLKNRDISLGLFFLSLCLPLFMAVPLILWYFKILKPPRKEKNTEEYEGCAVFCRGEGDEIADEIVEQVAGVYRENLWGGVCWEGIMNLRRLVMVIFYSFITDMLIRQMMMSMACFVILILHVKVQPFFFSRSNMVEFISLCILLIMSGVNMVKAGFLQAQAIPVGKTYYILVMYEWIEVFFLAILPLLLILVLLIALVILGLRKMCHSTVFHVRRSFPDTNTNTANRSNYSRRSWFNFNNYNPREDSREDPREASQPPVRNFVDYPRMPEHYNNGGRHTRPVSDVEDSFYGDQRSASNAYMIQRGIAYQNGSILWQNKVDSYAGSYAGQQWNSSDQAFRESGQEYGQPKPRSRLARYN